MQYKAIYTIFALIGAAVAQDFSNLPQCAMAPALTAFGKTGCAITDIKCLCSSTSLVPALESAVAAACSPSELAQLNTFAINTCKAAGVTLVIPGVSSGSASPTSTPSASGNSTVPASTTPSTTPSTTSSASTTAAVTMDTSSTSSGTTSASTSEGSTASAGSTTTSASQSSSSSPSATPSTGAGNVLQLGSSALAGALLLALAL